MERNHTPASYFIAIVAVLGSVVLMPPLPVFIVAVCPLLVLGTAVCLIIRSLLSQRMTLPVSRRDLEVCSQPLILSPMRQQDAEVDKKELEVLPI